MELKLYQIDAFANKPFEGNPAAVCPLDEWLPDNLLQAIAMENNLSETAYFVATENSYHLRWFTPLAEIDMCGHATLATAYVLFNILGYDKSEISFETRSGTLTVAHKGEWLEMDFPAQIPVECDIPEQIIKAFGVVPQQCLRSMDYIVVFDDEETVRSAKPNLMLLSELDLRGVAITSRSRDYDFVTRFFGPKFGINEDPVTGSAFTQLVPFWSNILDKTMLTTKQVSFRGGEAKCTLQGDRVRISGKAAQYMVGTIEI